MSIRRVLKVERVLAHRQPDLVLVADGVHKPHNLSALIRTCDGMGIGEIHCILARRFRPQRSMTMGSHYWVNLHFHDTSPGPLPQMKLDGYQIVCAHVGEQARCFRDIDYTRPTALVLGAEKTGVSAQVRKLADHEIVIPMYGMVESYNVSVAGGIILNEAVTQREKAGLYNRCRLDKKTCDELRFRWLQPKIAALCDEWGVPFPPLDDSGDLINPATWLAENKPR